MTQNARKTQKAQVDFEKIARLALHPTQAKILDKMMDLKKGDGASPTELAKVLKEPLGNVSYHVGVLAGKKKTRFEGSPLIHLVGSKQRRGALEHFYALV